MYLGTTRNIFSRPWSKETLTVFKHNFCNLQSLDRNDNDIYLRRVMSEQVEFILSPVAAASRGARGERGSVSRAGAVGAEE